jgi:class 3 adenylate cyclase/tetratricopeptide (TPR) repeat protein
MSERLDPEEVKEITGHLFDDVSKIINKYDGFIEKYAGDAVMALFGANQSHEDDPVRAVKSAKEIHDLVQTLSPQYEEKIGQSLSMHTGINTGLVVTGELNLEKGVHGVAGDAVNVASRLSSIAEPGEILIGPDTYSRAEGFFNFESLEPALVKGKARPIPIYKYVSSIEQPRKIHRLHGLRADLIGRKAEMAQLSEAVENLARGQGSVFSIIGTAGTGKSRLIEEFKATLNIEEVQWRIGQAYPYSQNIPYFPLIDLINRTLHIAEGDSPEKIREKIESRIEFLLDEKSDVASYIGSLYALSYPEIESVSPEFWKSKLQQAMRTVFSALAQRGPTIVCFEDLHWADPSSLDLVRFLLSQIRQPIIFICVYRPIITLFSSHQISSLPHSYLEITLQDLSRSDSQEMVQSLLRADVIPSDLQRFIQQKAEGNPFYLEEAINSLIESDFLVRDNGGWRITQQIGAANISSTIHGVISARVDRLEQESKRILQEASVIGRSFYYEILKKISRLTAGIDKCLIGLERLDLIKAKGIQPELEYFFKHALTQEVVYNGLLKKERRVIHERIALVIEHLFQDRLPEFYETLAFHFKNGHSTVKAVDYLMKSGEKSLKRYAVEESHKYYREAYELLANQVTKTLEENDLLIDSLNKWALVYYYRGDFRGLTKLFEENLGLADNVTDISLKGMFYAWLGAALTCRSRFGESFRYFKKALLLGERVEDRTLMGFIYCWLPWTCSGLGQLDDAIVYGRRAQEISRRIPSDQYINFKSLGGLGLTYFHRGEKNKVLDYGRKMVAVGREHSNIRSQAMGLWTLGMGHFLNGDIKKSVEYMERSVQTAADPFYAEFPRAFLGIALVQNSQWEQAEISLNRTIRFARKFGAEVQEHWANIYLGVVLVARGRMNKGINLIKETRQSLLDNDLAFFSNQAEYVLGKIYLQMVEKSEPISLSTKYKNMGFLIKTLPFAAKKAELHLLRVIEISKKYGSSSYMGYACLDLGMLYKLKKRNEKAREFLSRATKIFEVCEMDGFLQKTKEALESVKS